MRNSRWGEGRKGAGTAIWLPEAVFLQTGMELGAESIFKSRRDRSRKKSSPADILGQDGGVLGKKASPAHPEKRHLH